MDLARLAGPYRSSFRTHQVGVVSTRHGAIQIAEAYPRPRRVVVEPATLAGAPTYFIGSTSGELELPNSTPVNAFTLPNPFYQVIPLGPNQFLYAASSLPGSLLSVAISDALFAVDAPARLGRMQPSAFHTWELKTTARVPITGYGETRARRVLLTPILLPLPGAGQIHIASATSLGSEQYTVVTPLLARVFILQPRQQLWASFAPGAPGETAAVSVVESEIPYGSLPGSTGILGPGGEE